MPTFNSLYIADFNDKYDVDHDGYLNLVSTIRISWNSWNSLILVDNSSFSDSGKTDAQGKIDVCSIHLLHIGDALRMCFQRENVTSVSVRASK